MSVPNNYAFTLQNVCDAVYGDHNAGRTLAGCFTDSVATKFDSTYGSKTMSPKRMRGFRNYGVVSYGYLILDGTNASESEACSLFDPTGSYTVYCADSTLSVGSVLFSDSSLTTHEFAAASYWATCRDNNYTDRYGITVNSSSAVTHIANCSTYAFVTFDPTGLWKDNAGGTFTVNYVAGGYTFDLSCDDTWFTTSVSSITGTGSFTITIDANSTGIERISQISLFLSAVYSGGYGLRQDG